MLSKPAKKKPPELVAWLFTSWEKKQGFPVLDLRRHRNREFYEMDCQEGEQVVTHIMAEEGLNKCVPGWNEYLMGLEDYERSPP